MTSDLRGITVLLYTDHDGREWTAPLGSPWFHEDHLSWHPNDPGRALTPETIERAAKALYQHGSEHGIDSAGLPIVWDWDLADERVRDIYREWVLAVLLAVVDEPEATS